ncbi:ARM repeat superfamily protein isoform 2 [Hibiscus syriacus]|uniref:ARM repeat superfamily protein isoform 2 n=1 Tax=Hibiscus syriacus TaxID=106335 RepID=A0A6A3CY85_HIBSY|nr:ARM repeat superfamily protein isoform 2 [Hibiscus syriacus]
MRCYPITNCLGTNSNISLVCCQTGLVVYVASGCGDEFENVPAWAGVDLKIYTHHGWWAGGGLKNSRYHLHQIGAPVTTVVPFKWVFNWQPNAGSTVNRQILNEVKKETVNIVRGLTGSEDGLLSLSNYASSVLPLLSRILSDDKEVSEPAAEALVNLPQNAGLAAKMVEMGMIKIAMDLFYKPGFSITRLLVMLLVNLTQLDDGISSLLQVLL